MMKKAFGKILKALIFVMAIFVGIPIGLTVGKMIAEGSVGGRSLLELILALLIMYYVNIIIHEGGHLVFGLICGYRFCSFRIGSLMMIRQGGRLNFRSFKLAGTGGQCLMIPPEKGESRAQIILYNLGGVICNILFAVICITVGVLIPEVPLLTDVLMFSGFFSVFCAITNGVPMNVGGIANDGMNALHLSENPDAADAFRKTLLINAAQTEGMRIFEMPDEWFALPEGADMQNVHCASLAVFAASRYLDKGDTIGAERAIGELLYGRYNLVVVHRLLLTCDLIYCRLYNSPGTDVSGLITPDLQKLMSAMKNYPSVIRTEYAIALGKENNRIKAEDILVSYSLKTKRFPYPQEVYAEHNLMLILREKYSQYN